EPVVPVLNEMGQQYRKITKHISSNPKRATTYSEDGEAYCIKMKRKFYEATNKNDAVTPMYEPKGPDFNFTNDTHNATHDDVTASQERKDQLIRFVDELKKSLDSRRMNWFDCWKEGRSRGIVLQYTNYEVMKNAYIGRSRNTLNPSLCTLPFYFIVYLTESPLH
ncbi:uncharacterized protein BYT42DRAFT_502829, partial [Radiomyces spectabilis]|uniref:uncharacterized protein n=1 Tax=Radiomyces spectabilis TaxID=64574 RepID=UPI0022206E88